MCSHTLTVNQNTNPYEFRQVIDNIDPNLAYSIDFILGEKGYDYEFMRYIFRRYDIHLVFKNMNEDEQERFLFYATK